MARLARLPAEITVFAGDFASQPLAFAHLWDVAPELDFDHVEVIPRAGAEKRLAPFFDTATMARLTAIAQDTLILVLPAAHASPDCPLGETDRLTALGPLRGHVPHLMQKGTAP
ncbi:hypothetical protein N0B44_15240 [Roseibacterium beibuensis]|uniref:Uncharacterized protein n=1 Tax=[Roseibacterium] beibuensis TaxID=1193142 RepID=A0ABP9LC18_9RHOB|nr:hypothetical protein [Roseibacterium beibuensis]MCS6624272.1 hypothetical protein [Roseibacterium beibuensis]